MNTNIILKSDILDIIFENRNKEYGAYPLRKAYANRIKIATGLMLIASIAFCSLIIFHPQNVLPKKLNFEVNEFILTKVPEMPRQPQKPVEQKQTTPIQKNKKTIEPQQEFINNLKIVANSESVTAIKPLDEMSKISNKNVTSTGATVALVNSNINSTNDGVTNKIPTIDKTIPMNEGAVDVLPSYPGGMDALVKFLQKHLQTPDGMEDGQVVNVKVKFVVGYNGKLKDYLIVLNGGDDYNKEVIRVLKKMPDWIPGKYRGEEVSVYYTIPVKFISGN